MFLLELIGVYAVVLVRWVSCTALWVRFSAPVISWLGAPRRTGQGVLGVPGVVVPVELVPEGVVERELTKGAVLTTGVLVEPGFAHLLRQINQAQLGLLASSTRHRCSKLVSFIARPQWFWVDALIYLRSTRFQAG